MTHTRYVAHIDILGMSALVEKDAEIAWQVLSDLASVRNLVSAMEFEFIDIGDRARMIDRIQSVMFSDTIVLFTKSDTTLDLWLMLIATAELLHKAMCKCVPMRAGIAHGTFFFNIEKSMYAGPALIEAYRIGEQAQWLGITASEAVHRVATVANLRAVDANLVVQANIPIDDGPREGFAVNWPAVFAHDFKVKPPIPAEVFYSGFASAFGAYDSLPTRVRKKYENTVAFINHMLAGA